MAPKPSDKGEPKKDDDDKGTGTDPTAEVEKWKALARKHEAKSKENAEAAKKLAELDEADKTEIQKAADKAAAAEKRAEEAEARALRMEVAAEKGLNATQAKRLVGTTRDELETDADELLKSFKPTGNGDEGDDGEKEKGEGAPGRPKERLTGGGAPDDKEPDETDPRKLAASVPRL